MGVPLRQRITNQEGGPLSGDDVGEFIYGTAEPRNKGWD